MLDPKAIDNAIMDAKRYGMPLVLTNGLVGAAAKDKAWFDQHPDRAYRLREVQPDDAAAIVGCTHVIVRRVCKGARSRVFFAMPGVEALQDPDDGLCALLLQEVNDPTGCSAATLAVMYSMQSKGGVQ